MGKNRKPHNASVSPTGKSTEVAAVSSDQNASLAAGTEGSATDVVNTKIVQVAEDAPGGVASIETVTYPDGVTATGVAPLPAESPAAEPVPSDTVALSILGTINETPQAPTPSENPPSSTESSETRAIDPVPEATAEQLEPAIADIDDGYVPLMTLENIAKAANEAAFAVAVQAGAPGRFDDDSDVAALCVDFVRQWPEAPVGAMLIHVCRSSKAPIFEFDDMPAAARVSLRAFRLVALECLAAEKEHRAKFDADLRDRDRRLTEKAAYDRADLAMTPDDDNPLSELGRAATRG